MASSFTAPRNSGIRAFRLLKQAKKQYLRPVLFSPPHVVHSLAPVWIRIRYEPTDMFVFKHYALIGLSGVIHSFDLTKGSVHDIHYLKDVKVDYSNCTVIGDRGYISAQIQLDLFETANIRLEVPYRTNQKEWKPTFPAFAKARKRIETLFSQLCDQFMIIRNYAKDTDGLFTRIVGKISALTILQYINYKNKKPIGRVKYALI